MSCGERKYVTVSGDIVSLDLSITRRIVLISRRDTQVYRLPTRRETRGGGNLPQGARAKKTTGHRLKHISDIAHK